MQVVPDTGTTDTEASPRKRKFVFGVVAIAALFLAAIVFVEGGGTAVDYVRIEYGQSPSEACGGNLVEGGGAWEEATLEIWGPNRDNLYRLEMTFPDGSSEFAVVADLLSLTGSERIFTPRPEVRMGSELTRWRCSEASTGSFGTIDIANYQDFSRIGLGFFITMDTRVPGRSATVFQELTTPQFFEGVTFSHDGGDVIDRVETEVFTHRFTPGPYEVFRRYWVDMPAERVQRQETGIEFEGGTFVQELTVVERDRDRVALDFFDTTGLVQVSA